MSHLTVKRAQVSRRNTSSPLLLYLLDRTAEIFGWSSTWVLFHGSRILRKNHLLVDPLAYLCSCGQRFFIVPARNITHFGAVVSGFLPFFAVSHHHICPPSPGNLFRSCETHIIIGTYVTSFPLISHTRGKYAFLFGLLLLASSKHTCIWCVPEQPLVEC